MARRHLLQQYVGFVLIARQSPTVGDVFVHRCDGSYIAPKCVVIAVCGRSIKAYVFCSHNVPVQRHFHASVSHFAIVNAIS